MTASYPFSDTFLVAGVAVNGGIVTGYKLASTLGNVPPSYNTVPPNEPDAGPVTTGLGSGSPGRFIIDFPTYEPYWICITYNGNYNWAFCPGASIAGANATYTAASSTTPSNWQETGDTVPRLTISNTGSITTSKDGTTAQLNEGFYNFAIPSQGSVSGAVGVCIQANTDEVINNPFMIIDHNGAPIKWVLNAGGEFITDNWTSSNGVFGTPPLQIARSGLTSYGQYHHMYNIGTPSPSVAANAGGSLTSGTPYYWVMTAVRNDGSETVASSQVTLTPSGSNLSASVSCSHVPGACFYKLYRTTTSGTYGATSLVSEIQDGEFIGNPTIVDTGAALSTGTPPTNPTGNTQLVLQRWAGAFATTPAVQLISEFGTVVSQWTYAGALQAGAGSVSNPSFASYSDTTGTGIYFPASGQIAIGNGGTETVLITATGLVGSRAASATVVDPVPALRPSGWTSESIPRQTVSANTVGASASGTLRMNAVYLQVGTVVSNLCFVTGTTAGATMTHNWMALYDDNLNQLAVTADKTSAAIAASSLIEYAIATTAAGSATSFTATYSGLHYVGWMVAATTLPTLMGQGGSAQDIWSLAPVLAGTSDTGQTTPPSFPHTATALTITSLVYCGTA